MRTNSRLRIGAALIGATLVSMGANAQAPAVTTADYARAESFLRDKVIPLVSGMGVQPIWLSNDRLGYRNPVAGGGTQFILVDPARGTRLACSPETDRCGGALDPGELSRLRPPGRAPGTRPEVLSPDGKSAAFIRNFNLWVRDVATGRENQLTTDGQKDFGYATDNAGWVKSDRPVLVWSPDSKKIATFQQDERNVGDMYLVTTKVGHPELQAWKYPLPGDSVIAMISRVVIDVAAPRVIRFQMPPDPHRSTLCDQSRATGWRIGE